MRTIKGIYTEQILSCDRSPRGKRDQTLLQPTEEDEFPSSANRASVEIERDLVARNDAWHSVEIACTDDLDHVTVVLGSRGEVHDEPLTTSGLEEM